MAAAKWSNDNVMDAALDYIATATRLYVITNSVSATPTFEEVSNTCCLADVTIDSGDFAKSDGTSGRKTTVAAQSSIGVDGDGVAYGVALAIAASSTVVYTTTCTAQSLVTGNTVTVPAWTIQIGDPT